MYYLIGTHDGRTYAEKRKMRYVVIFFYGSEPTKKVKEYAALERKQGHSAQIRDARTFQGEREECHRAIILPSVEPRFRAKIEAVYGPAIIVGEIDEAGNLVQPPYNYSDNVPSGLPPSEPTKLENTIDGPKPTLTASQQMAATESPIALTPNAGMPSSVAYPQTEESAKHLDDDGAPQLPPRAEETAKPRLSMPQRRR